VSYADESFRIDPFAADAAADARAGFIRRTYLHLFGAIVAFMGLETVFLTVEPVKNAILRAVAGNWWIALIGFMAVSWLARWWASSGASPLVQYAGLSLYTVAEAVIFVPLLYFATRFGGPSLVPTAAFLTLLIFGGLTVTVFVTGADFSFLRGALVIASLLAVGAVFANVFFGFGLGIWFSAAMVGLMSGYILYDTSNVLHHYRTDQHVAASLALFASVATLFWYVIRLLMSLSDD
jgi:FtsH-binding integral membrane protein